jgi:hypothetical protein
LLCKIIIINKKEKIMSDAAGARAIADASLDKVLDRVVMEWTTMLEKNLQITEMQNRWAVAKKAADAARVG